MPNLLASPEDFTDTGTWTTGGSITRTANTHTAPDGNLTADTISFDGAFTPLQQTVAVSQSTQYTFSFYAKAGTCTTNRYAIYDNSNGADIVGQTQYDGLINSSTWSRVTVTFTTPSGCTQVWCMVGRNSGPGSVILWGAYLNVGAEAEPYPGVGDTLAPSLVSNSNTLYAATVTAGAVTLSPSRLDDAEAFYGPTVSQGLQIQPLRFDNAAEFFSPSVASDSYVITLAQAQLLYQVYLLHGLQAGQPLTVSQTERLAGGVVQAISEAGGAVTITTTAVPSSVVDPGAVIEELALLHGLGGDLMVSSSTRSVGSILQSIASAGGVSTVTRQ